MEYCDFVCWTPHGTHIERILLDTLFETIKPALDTFFLKVLLMVEHSGNRHKALKALLTCLKKMTPTAHAMERMKVQWLLGTMQCPLQWFHFECVGLSANHMGNGTVVLYAGMQRHKVFVSFK